MPKYIRYENVLRAALQARAITFADSRISQESGEFFPEELMGSGNEEFNRDAAAYIMEHLDEIATTYPIHRLVNSWTALAACRARTGDETLDRSLREIEARLRQKLAEDTRYITSDCLDVMRHVPPLRTEIDKFLRENAEISIDNLDDAFSAYLASEIEPPQWLVDQARTILTCERTEIEDIVEFGRDYQALKEIALDTCRKRIAESNIATLVSNYLVSAMAGGGSDFGRILREEYCKPSRKAELAEVLDQFAAEMTAAKAQGTQPIAK
jgi:hypothetical protein